MGARQCECKGDHLLLHLRLPTSPPSPPQPASLCSVAVIPAEGFSQRALFVHTLAVAITTWLSASYSTFHGVHKSKSEFCNRHSNFYSIFPPVLKVQNIYSETHFCCSQYTASRIFFNFSFCGTVLMCCVLHASTPAISDFTSWGDHAKGKIVKVCRLNKKFRSFSLLEGSIICTSQN